MEVDGTLGRRTAAAIFLAVLAVSAALVTISLVRHDGSITALLRVGRYSASRSFIEHDFDDPVLTEDAGHDGQQFYVLAATFPDLPDATDHVDKIRYRGRRVLYPAILSPLPSGEPLVWGMLAVNLVATASAAVAVGVLAARQRLSPWLGLSVAVTPALIESTEGVLADSTAFALALWGVVVFRRRPALAGLLFLLAVLTRETTLVVPLACALVGSGRQRLGPAIAGAGYLAWLAISGWWLPATQGGSSNDLLADALLQVELPFSEWFRQGWQTEQVMLGALLFAGSLTAAWILRDRLPEVSLWLLGDAVLLTIADEGIVSRAMNFARVAPMAVPAMALAVALVMAARSERESHTREPDRRVSTSTDGDGDAGYAERR